MAKPTQLVHLTGAKDHPTVDVSVEPLGGDRFAVTIGDERVEVEGFLTDRGVHFRIGAQAFDIPVERRDDLSVVYTAQARVEVELADARMYRLRAALGGGAGTVKPELKSPMTGKVVLVNVAPGDTVAAGKPVVIIEAMKMENEIKAPGDAVVKAVRVAPGQLVAPGDVLLEFDV
jgi:biotin carboxyl carrier protein